MNWLTELPSSQPIAWAVLALMLIAVAGMAMAQIKVKGVGIGVTGVLLAGIIAGHFGVSVDNQIVEFVRDFGLILFVFTIGLQLGPGVGASFLKQGLRLNVLAARDQSWSLMPDGVEQGMSAQDFADLLEYLMSAGR